MKLLAFSVRDEAVGAFLQPMFFRAKGEAIRAFADAVGNPEHQFAKHLNDYVFYFVGEFDDQAGRFVVAEPVRVLGAFECASRPDSAS